MFLKSMELLGFKSFAEKTLIEFVPGITAIVGSNGCGKSNVVDAIKWAVGEKQAKNLRGTQMSDVIFSGTETRPALSIAEVIMTIDNTERVLDFDADTVTVGRRVFRDGESEYLINKSPVRLKDIEKLFMDTGIGKSSYSVMEQGQMDMILSKRAEDRRYIFEEAAGISKYKLQKKDSMRRLEETRENLNRINDIIKELELQKELKSKQAEKTKAYLALKERFKEADIKLNAFKFRELDAKLAKINENIDKLKAEKDKISARVASISSENEADENRLNEILRRLWEIEKRLEGYKIRKEEQSAKSQKNSKAIAEQKEYLEAAEKKLAASERRHKDIADEIAVTEKNSSEVKAKLAEDKAARQKYFDKRKSKLEAINASRDAIENNERSIAEHERAQEQLRSELEVVIRELIQVIDKRKAELAASEEERQQTRSEFHALLAEADAALRQAKAALASGSADAAIASLDSIDMELIKNTVGKFESFEDGFRSILFDKTGIHAKKEALDNKISQHVNGVAELRDANAKLNALILQDQAELESVNDMLSRIEKDISKRESDGEWMDKNLANLAAQLKDVDMQTENHREDIKRTGKNIRELETEIEEGKGMLAEYDEKSSAALKDKEDLEQKQKTILEGISKRKSASAKDEEDLTKLTDRIINLEKSTVEYTYSKERIEEHLWTDYEKHAEECARLPHDGATESELSAEYQTLNREQQILSGQVNPLAIEEFNEIRKRFDYFIDQRMDIEKAREDILSVIDDINKTSVEMFLSTFKEIEKNFSQIFRRLFEGGAASIRLLNEEDVLESGIDIDVRPPGKKPKNINELSGGEKALTAIALMFATYMVRPSPFCFLDEVDSPLDEQNIGRFLRLLREFAAKTQFVIITHKKTTMRACESMYGVTMEERGVSKVISIKMADIKTVD